MIDGFRKSVDRISGLVAQRGGWSATVKAAATIVSSEGISGLQLRFKKAQHDIKICHGAPEDGDYVNVFAATRGDVLFSDSHVRLLAALRGESSLPGNNATLGLALATLDSADRLPTFLDSLTTQSYPLSRIHVAIVDCGSTDNTLQLLNNYFANYGERYGSFTIATRFDRELPKGHDQAIRHLTNTFVFVANASVEFQHNTIERALEAATADSHDVATWELRQAPLENPKYYDPVTLAAVWNSHSCILLRRSAYLEVGGYDHRLRGYGEDVDLSYRLRGAGWTLRYLPQITATHRFEPIQSGQKAVHWTRSAEANILLRHRFATPQVAAEGEAELSRIAKMTTSTHRRASLIRTQRIIARDSAYFSQTMRPEIRVPFPFQGLDYVMSRQGAGVSLPFDPPGRASPRVTVITRTHGPRLGMLREAITSVLNQTYTNIEHLIVEDRTGFAEQLVADVVHAYGTDIRFLASDGPGRAAAGNLGLAEATGEFIMFLDDDDLLFPDHIELLTRTLTTYKGLIGAYALSWEVQTEFDEAGCYREVSHFLPGSQWLDFDVKRLAKANFIPIQSMLFRRTIYERAGGFLDDLDHLEDWNLWWRYSQFGRFMLVRKITSLFRTPADPEIRARRQDALHAPYERVRSLNGAVNA